MEREDNSVFVFFQLLAMNILLQKVVENDLVEFCFEFYM